MNNTISETPGYRKIWELTSHFMKALDEAVDHDPQKPIIQKLKHLEFRLDRLEQRQPDQQTQLKNSQKLEISDVN